MRLSYLEVYAVTRSLTLSADAAAIPVVCVVVGGGIATIRAVVHAIDQGTPAIIVEVFEVI